MHCIATNAASSSELPRPIAIQPTGWWRPAVEIHVRHHVDGQLDPVHRDFERGPGKLAFALRGVPVTDREQRAVHADRQIQRTAGDQFPAVEIPAEPSRPDGGMRARFRWRHPHYAEERPQPRRPRSHTRDPDARSPSTDRPREYCRNARSRCRGSSRAGRTASSTAPARPVRSTPRCPPARRRTHRTEAGGRRPAVRSPRRSSPASAPDHPGTGAPDHPGTGRPCPSRCPGRCAPRTGRTAAGRARATVRWTGSLIALSDRTPAREPPRVREPR